MKDEIVRLLAKKFGMSIREVDDLVEVPPKEELGDYAIPVFIPAGKLGQSPMMLSGSVVAEIKKELPGENIVSNGAYVNYFEDRKVLAERVLAGKGKIKKMKGKVVIDMSSPNIAKPFGIGHLRSTIIGNSIGRICEANGFSVIKINYLGDWGTQFGRVVFGFKKWGNEVKLKKNPVEHLYELYVRAGDESLKDDSCEPKYDDGCREEFRRLEDGDAESVRLWKRFRRLSVKEFEEIYDLLGVEFDVVSGESFYNGKIETVVNELKRKKLLKKNEGAEIVDLKDEGLGVALIRKSDGTSLYATRDIAAAIARKKKYKFDRMIYEVGNEQGLHFRQLFRILDKMGYVWSKDCVHVAHGLYLDESGKKFATRKGKTVFMKDILNGVIKKAKKSLLDRGKLGKVELEKRARKIALAAIFYGDLKNSREGNVVFDVDRFLSFEGDTGPYLLYSYARAFSILRKAKKKAVKMLDLKKEEVRLLKKIDSFGDVVVRAYDNLAPNLVANYCFELAQIFNEFYHSCPVLGSESEGFRVGLVSKFCEVLREGLYLLGIETLDEM